jgi:hypothetical protein
MQLQVFLIEIYINKGSFLFACFGRMSMFILLFVYNTPCKNDLIIERVTKEM